MGLRKHALKERIEMRVIPEPTTEILDKLYQVEINAHDSPWSYDSIASSFADNTRCIGLFLKDELIGFSVICILYDEAELYTIGIVRKYQGLGFGHKLLLHSLHMARDLGAKNCYLEVRISNSVALYLYDLYGFQITGTRKNYYPATSTSPAENAYTMACDLSELPEEIIDKSSQKQYSQESTGQDSVSS